MKRFPLLIPINEDAYNSTNNAKFTLNKQHSLAKWKPIALFCTGIITQIVTDVKTPYD